MYCQKNHCVFYHSEMREEYTIIIVTHHMQQAARISDYTAYLYLGKLIEYGLTPTIFNKATKQATRDYIAGKLLSIKQLNLDSNNYFYFSSMVILTLYK